MVLLLSANVTDIKTVFLEILLNLDYYIDTGILEQLEETFAQEITLAGNDLGLLEMLVREKLRLLGQGSLYQ